MSPEAQRIALAEYCGWRHGGYLSGCYQAVPPGGGTSDLQEIPDYLTDLNAMHEAEGKIYPDFSSASLEDVMRWSRYCKNLSMATFPEAQDGSSLHGRYIRATAAQRAEAFLRTIGKWKGGES